VSSQVSERQRAGERRNFERDQRRVRRTPPLTLGLVILLTLAVGIVAAIDLRRLDSPGGAALSWTEAAVFGDCDRYLLLSAAEAGSQDPRPREEVCAVLRETGTAALAQSTMIQVRLVSAQPGSAELVVLRPEGEVPVHLDMVRDGRWEVARNASACGAVGCP